MTKTKKHFAIISLLVCLFASFALALGFGNTKKASAEGETNYTLSFQKETDLITTKGWSGTVAPTLSDGVLDFKFSTGGQSFFYSFNTVKGKTYSIKFEAQAVGETGGIGVNLFTSDI